MDSYLSADQAYSSNMSQENDSHNDDNNSWLVFNNSSTGGESIRGPGSVGGGGVASETLLQSAVNAATTALFEKCEENAKMLKAKGLTTSASVVDGYTIEEEDLKKILREHNIDPSVFTSVMAAFPSTLQGNSFFFFFFSSFSFQNSKNDPFLN